MSEFIKRLACLILSVVLVLAMAAPAFAVDEDTGYVSDPDEPGTITVPGGVNAIDDDIYEMTLPVSSDLGFQLDPQGIYYGEAGALLSELDGGKIIPLAAGKIVNHSSYAVNMSVQLTATSTSATNTDDTKFLDFDEDAETTIENVNTGTDNNVLLLAVPSTKNVINTKPFDGEDVVFQAAADGFVITNTACTLDFYLRKAEFTLADGKTEFLEVADTASGTALQIAGYVNPNASWSKYIDPDGTGAGVADTTIEVSVKFIPSRAAAVPEVDDYVDGVANLLATSTASDAVPTGAEDNTSDAQFRFINVDGNIYVENKDGTLYYGWGRDENGVQFRCDPVTGIMETGYLASEGWWSEWSGLGGTGYEKTIVRDPRTGERLMNCTVYLRTPLMPTYALATLYRRVVIRESGIQLSEVSWPYAPPADAYYI